MGKKTQKYRFSMWGASENDWKYGISDKKFKAIKNHDGKLCIAEVEVNNGEFDDNYYNIKFADGFTIEGVSGIHLSKK